MSDADRDDKQEAAKKRKNKAPPKALPNRFDSVTKADLSGFRLNRKPSLSKGKNGELTTIADTFAYAVTSSDGVEEFKVEVLNDLTLLQLIALCKQLGLRHIHNLSKFEVLGMIALLIENKVTESSVVVAKTKDSLCLSGYLCRFINCLFLNEHRDNWFSLNDIKNRKDHEGLPGSTMLPKHFWPYIAEMIGAGGKDVTMEGNSNDSSSSDDIIIGNSMEKDLRKWWSPGESDPVATSHIKDEYQNNPALSLCGILPGFDATYLMMCHRELHHV